MPSDPLRFVHASDFHLDEPPGGMTEIPGHLRDLLVDSAYRAAGRVFQTVLDERADFLVLSGDIIDPAAAGPRGLSVLIEGLERLAERGVAVYWAAGRAERRADRSAWELFPPNVHFFPHGGVEEILHCREEKRPVARVIGVGRSRQGKIRLKSLRPSPTGLFSLAVAHGRIDAGALEDAAVDYWALGKEHARRTLRPSSPTVHWPGTPQGRSPREPGPHGCTLVDVDEAGRIRSRFVPTDVVRWVSERIEVDESITRHELEELLRGRMVSLIEKANGRDMMISWSVVSPARLAAQLCHGPLAASVLAWLREEFGTASPAAWSVSLAAEADDVLPPARYEEDTILGDFLRLVREYQGDECLPIDLSTYLSPQHEAGLVGSAATLTDQAARQRILCEAALLGADLLGGDLTAGEGVEENWP